MGILAALGTLLVVVMEMLLHKCGKVSCDVFENPGCPWMVWRAVGRGFGTLFGGPWVPLGGMGMV